MFVLAASCGGGDGSTDALLPPSTTADAIAFVERHTGETFEPVPTIEVVPIPDPAPALFTRIGFTPMEAWRDFGLIDIASTEVIAGGIGGSYSPSEGKVTLVADESVDRSLLTSILVHELAHAARSGSNPEAVGDVWFAYMHVEEAAARYVESLWVGEERDLPVPPPADAERWEQVARAMALFGEVVGNLHTNAALAESGDLSSLDSSAYNDTIGSTLGREYDAVTGSVVDDQRLDLMFVYLSLSTVDPTAAVLAARELVGASLLTTGPARQDHCTTVGVSFAEGDHFLPLAKRWSEETGGSVERVAFDEVLLRRCQSAGPINSPTRPYDAAWLLASVVRAQAADGPLPACAIDRTASSSPRVAERVSDALDRQADELVALAADC